MSFILDALKKSENKRRRKSGQNPRTILEPIPRNNIRSRTWILGILTLLLVNAALLLWFFGFWQQPSSQPTEALSADVAPIGADIEESVVPQAIYSATQQNTEPVVAVTPKQQPLAKALPVPRSEKKIYSFVQLPVAIQRQIPPLQMSLHAYNRDDSAASLVQLNERIMRAGDMVADHIRLEQITADGAVLYYDGYRFLLPRRGN